MASASASAAAATELVSFIIVASRCVGAVGTAMFATMPATEG